MNNLKRLVLSLSSLLLVSGVAISVPAYAEDGGSGNTTNTTSSDNQTSQNSGSGSSNTESATGNQDKTEVDQHAQELKLEFQKHAQEQLTEQKSKVKEQTKEHRQQSCEARKENLTKRMSDSVAHANKIKALIDEKFAKVKDFVTTKQLTVPDYSSLTAKVDAAQADAAAQITALQSLDVNVDCTSQTVASSVSAFKQAVQSTRDSLKAYRKALVDDLIKAVKEAASATQTTTENNSTTNTTGQ